MDNIKITLVVKAGRDTEWAKRVAIGRLNEWYTDRVLADGPDRFEPGALLSYSVQDVDAPPAPTSAPVGRGR